MYLKVGKGGEGRGVKERREKREEDRYIYIHIKKERVRRIIGHLHITRRKGSWVRVPGVKEGGLYRVHSDHTRPPCFDCSYSFARCQSLERGSGPSGRER